MKELIPVPSRLPTFFITALLNMSSTLLAPPGGTSWLRSPVSSLLCLVHKVLRRPAKQSCVQRCCPSVSVVAWAWLGPAELREGSEHLYPAAPHPAPPSQRTAPLPHCCSKDVHRLVLAVLDTKRRMHGHVSPSEKAPLVPRLGF